MAGQYLNDHPDHGQPRTAAGCSYDRAAAHAMLDEAYVCHLGFVVDGEPRVLPTLHVRVGDTVYLHGSTGSRPLLAARGPSGLPVCLAVTLLDGLVYARSQAHHSANYRSVVAHGAARHGDRRGAQAPGARRPGRQARRRPGRGHPPTHPRASWPPTAVLAAAAARGVACKVRTGGPATTRPT